MFLQRIRVYGIACSIFAALIAAPALAAPVHSEATSVARIQPTEGQKFTLPESSIAGPALWSQAVTTPRVGSPPVAVPLAVLAWTGTDPNHSLNVETSSDGLHYGNKVTLDESSITAPAVLVVNANIIVLAWVGSDPHHLLNVLYDVSGSPKKITLQDNSDAPPALAAFNGNIYLAWRGTDNLHLLNVRNMGPQGTAIGTAVTLTQYTSVAGPGLAADPLHNQLLLTWTDTGKSSYLPAPQQFINFLASSDGTNWHTVLVAPPPQTSIAGPSIMAISPAPSTFEDYFWAWTGTDPQHSLNLATSGTVNGWQDPITTFNEQAVGAPALGYMTALNNTVLIAWTGVDPDHSLNIAEITV
jgi:hypothetical protein